MFYSSGGSDLSLCMIMKNEEEFLGRCLESVKDAVDEMIIVLISHPSLTWVGKSVKSLAFPLSSVYQTWSFGTRK